MSPGKNYPAVTVVFICHDGEGNYLLAKRSNKTRDEHGTWDPGGGAIEFGQTIEETLQKEILEEYGTSVLAFEFLGFRDVRREQNGVKTHWIALDFKVLVDRSAVHNAEPHKHDAIGWFRLEEFPDPPHSQFPYFLEKYKINL